MCEDDKINFGRLSRLGQRYVRGGAFVQTNGAESGPQDTLKGPVAVRQQATSDERRYWRRYVCSTV